MGIQVIVVLSIDLSGDDYSTGEPDAQQVVLENSPAQLWQYEVQGPAFNYLLVSQSIPASALWIDPLPNYGDAPSGATFILMGSTLDVGVPISSTNPSLIPVTQGTPFGGTFSVPSESGVTFLPAPQDQIVLESSQPVQLQIGWF